MARPRKYNREQVLNHAMKLFWSQGYNATNMPQLLEYTGLSASSFYAAFGDKRQLYIECFKFYTQSLETILNVVKKSYEPADAIHHYFSIVLHNTLSENSSNGCLIINSLIEFENVDAELYELAQQKMDITNDAFRQCFINAIGASNINTTLTPDELTQYLCIVFAGIQVNRRAGLSHLEISSSIDIFLSSIGAKPIDVLQSDNHLNKMESTL